jgi:hypothetical protein
MKEYQQSQQKEKTQMPNFDEHMELGTTGWVPIGNGSFKNIHNEHIIDAEGREFDKEGNIIFDPKEDLK